ncbi:MAG TPA: deoxyribonuclease V [Candidatus Ozemobacteraceae bacterium]|nr:deoxyribonuclease V [Candidatus Ozemobacteraceae bacterium]HQG29490.1 deoxyribonuclease V [Candidatus Ozemobacteraceae bacterium]
MNALHAWDVSPSEAIEIQQSLVKRIVRRGDSSARLIAGIDCSFEKTTGEAADRGTIYAAIVIWDSRTGTTVEEAFSVMPATFPYVPGLLTFREGPAVLDAWRTLKTKPDAAIFDGHGIAHPRGIGIASHLGLWLDLPSIGCAKSRLCGEAEEPGPEAGSVSDLRLDDRLIGNLVRTRSNVKPVFVSIGHKICLEAAVRLVLSSCRGYRLPEPTRLAHIAGNRLRLD